jgi:tRNA A37 threonylcarbamoyladenosine synthetase subunit TsaC/SUA5/YrdC
VCTSLHDSDKLIDYTTDINEIITNWNDKVDFIIEGDMIGNIPSTVIDLTSNSPEVIRLGRGEW